MRQQRVILGIYKNDDDVVNNAATGRRSRSELAEILSSVSTTREQRLLDLTGPYSVQ